MPSPHASSRDRYGGHVGLPLGSSGFFRIEHADRWWLVTPEGNAFLSLGLNHVESRILRMPYNRLHWASAFGLPHDATDEAFLPGYRAKVRDDMRYLGMNTLGCHSPVDEYIESWIPYVYTLRFVDICHYMTPSESDFLDVFSPAFERHCDALAQQQALPRRDDPYLLGYFFTDGPVLTEDEAAPRTNTIYGSHRPQLPTWPRVLRNLPASAPGKQAYVQYVRRRYHDDIRAFNAVYDSSFSSFDGLASAEQWRPNGDATNAAESADNEGFLWQVVERCYQVQVDAVRRYDPNHLIVGDKINVNLRVPDEQLRLVDRFFDVVFYQYYALWDEQASFMSRVRRITAKPIFNGDASCSSPYEQMPNPLGPQLPDQETRTREALCMLKGSFAQPDFLGWHWCGWMDRWRDVQPNKQHSGLQDPFGRWYPLQSALADFSQRMYDIARSGDPDR